MQFEKAPYICHVIKQQTAMENTINFNSRETKVTLNFSTQTVTILDVPTGETETRFVENIPAAISYWTKYTNEELTRGK